MARGKRLLAVDTATLVASLALCEEGVAVAELSVRTRVSHSESLLADVDALLRRTGWTLADLDGFACATGPGSFTGVRIGLTTLRTLAWTLGRPLAGRGSLEVLAGNAAGRPGLVATALDARKGEVYLAVWRTAAPGAPVPVLGPDVLAPERALACLAELPRADGEPLWLLGDGVARYPETFRAGALPGLTTAPPADHRPRAAILGALVHEELTARGWQADPKQVVPLYVRPSEAELGAARKKPREAEAAAAG
jgi:tRNA threonylcarbamoyladenosine biosynthesis protein TsaB